MTASMPPDGIWIVDPTTSGCGNTQRQAFIALGSAFIRAI
jgi:hypothetical protein